MWKLFLLLHIGYWSLILFTGRTNENNQKQSRGWTEMYRYYEMIYADAHVRYEQFSVSLSLELVTGVPANGWVPRWGQGFTAGLRLSTHWPKSRRNVKCGLKDNIVWYGQEKNKLWVNIAVGIRLPLSPFVSVCHRLSPSISHTTEALTPSDNKVWASYLFNQVLWSFVLHVYFSLCHSITISASGFS